MTDKISEIFDIEPIPAQPLPILVKTPPEFNVKKVSNDSESARDNLKQLIETARTALTHALEVAVQSESPRAYEVLATMINTAADLNTKLIDIHQKEQKMVTSGTPQPEVVGNVTNVQNNVVFSGTTEELNAILMKKGLKL